MFWLQETGGESNFDEKNVEEMFIRKRNTTYKIGTLVANLTAEENANISNQLAIQGL